MASDPSADTVQVNGYTVHWVNVMTGAVSREKLHLIRQAVQGTDIYNQAASDLHSFGLAADNQKKLDLRALLKYYFFAFTTFHTQARLMPQILGNVLRIGLLDDIRNALATLEASLRAMGDDMSAVPAVPGRAGWIVIPNRQVLELLVYAKFDSLDAAHKPTNLRE